MNKLRSVLRDVAGPERVHAADIVYELCESQWLSIVLSVSGIPRRAHSGDCRD